MKTSRSAWIQYVTLRLLFFVVPFAIIYWLGLQLGFSLALSGGVAAVLAALISVSLSVIFLARPRAIAAQSIVDWRNRDRTVDDIEEDDALDGGSTGSATEADDQVADMVSDVVAEESTPATTIDPDAAPRS